MTDERGATPAHISAAHDCAEGLRLLRGAKGALWASDAHGYTPLQLARHGRRASPAARTILFMEGAVDGNLAAAMGAPEDSAPLDEEEQDEEGDD